MILAICDVCGCQAFFGERWVVGERTFFLGSCCSHRPFRVPEPIAATVTVRKPDGSVAAYEVRSQ